MTFVLCSLQLMPYGRVPTVLGTEGGKIPVGGKKEIWKFCQNTGSFVCSTSKFLDSKIWDIVVIAVIFFRVF